MKTVTTSLDGVLILDCPVFSDDRGFFTEVYHKSKFAGVGMSEDFMQDNHSRSTNKVLRGLHYQLNRPQGKLVRPITGVVFDVAVDIRRSSPTFRSWVGTTLTAGDGRQLWVPPGFAHGFIVLSEVADVFYKCTTEYDPASERTIRWDDPAIGVEWPLDEGETPHLSRKDAEAPYLDPSQCFP